MADQRYFANAGPTQGPWRGQNGIHTIGVFGHPSDPLPIGIAYPSSYIPDLQGAIITFRLTLDNADSPGQWVVISREFLPLQSITADM